MGGATNRYLGLRFHDLAGKTHYGWARLTVRGTQNSRIVALLTGYAYETVPNKAIIAGRTADADAAISSLHRLEPHNRGASMANPLSRKPQAATLGALARGAPALSIWRRKKT